MNTAISIEGIGKKYSIGQQKSGDFRESFRSLISNKKTFFSKTTNPQFWALKDITFDVNKGDTIGIIGRNGAGKSTLLKILSRITKPSTGRFWLEGRVSSLLEVGTGFHPELTGRENIFLNGTILGMKRVEVKEKLNEIIDFSGVSGFLDTPVKHYSSGMKVRLAFSVAAHLEPEILIIDEVLAVGDAEFQKKCLGKMEDVAGQGRTVLFVSHNMAAVSNLCNKGIFLQNGHIKNFDTTKNCISQYLEFSQSLNQYSLLDRNDRKGTGIIRFEKIDIIVNKREVDRVLSGDDVTFRFYFHKEEEKEYKNFRLDVGINNSYNERILWLSSELTDGFNTSLHKSTNFIELSIPNFPLNSGRFSMTLFATVSGDIVDWIRNGYYFDVEAGDFFKSGKKTIERQGYFLVNHIFENK